MRQNPRGQAHNPELKAAIMALAFLKRLFDRSEGRDTAAPLYQAVIAEARDPVWYLDHGVPDTVDGRFDMVAAMLSLVLIRLEREGEAGRHPSTMLTELFVDDMDGQLREEGIGDVVVGKHIGRMMAALGGRLDAYRAAMTGTADLEDALRRNVWRGEEVAQDRVAGAAARMRDIAEALGSQSLDALLGGKLRA